MKKKYQIILVILTILIAISTFIEIRYQNFLNVKKLSDSLVFVDENLSINYLNGNVVSGNGTIKVHFSVTNVSNKDINYFISLENITNNSDDLTYSLKSSNDINNVDYELITDRDVIIGNNILIKPNESIGYDLFINNASDLNMSIKVGYEKDYINLLRDLMLSNSNNLVKVSDDDGASYYYQGSAQDNYVIINNQLFRIIRINGDNSIRLITEESVSVSAFNNQLNQSYLDYNGSSINNYLNNYYHDNFSSFDSIIEEENYCSDVSVYNTIDDVSYYNTYNDLINNNISLHCNNPYRKKIGLISAFEYSLINGSSNYLNKKDTEFYTSTYAYQKNGSFPNIVTIKDGVINYDSTSDMEHLIYPVINLNKDVYAIGAGTITNPYKIIYEK